MMNPVSTHVLWTSPVSLWTADLATVFAWGHARLGPALAVEIGQVLVAGFEADLGDGPVGLKQHRARSDDPQPPNGVGEAAARGPGEEAGEPGLRHTNDPGRLV